MLSRFCLALMVVASLSFAGCGGRETKATSADELSNYVNENADQIAKQEEKQYQQQKTYTVIINGIKLMLNI